MASQNEIVQVLTQLGLTLSQARVYLALALSGESTAKTISKVSEVAREHVYETMLQLQDLGLVEKEITVPSKFQSIPIKEGLSILLERRARETCELQAKTRELIKNLKKNNTGTKFWEEESQFILIPKEEATIHRILKEIENAQTSIDVVANLNRFLRAAFTYAEVTNKALEKGVKIRVITQEPEDEKSLHELVQNFKKNPSFKLRYLLTPPLAAVTVYDKKEVLLTTSPTANLAESPALWSNNPSLLAIVNDYFETLWITALENKH